MAKVARKGADGPVAIVNDLARTVALASMATAASQSFSFALNAVDTERGAVAGDVVIVNPRTVFAAGTGNVRGRISAQNTVTVLVESDAVTVAAQTATIDTAVIMQPSA